MSISHALAAANAVRRQLDCGSKNTIHQATNPAEIAEGRLQKEKAQSALRSSIAVVNQTLAALRKVDPNLKVSPTAQQQPVSSPSEKSIRPTRMASSLDPGEVRISTADPVQNVMDAMSAGGLQPGTASLDEMAKAIGPIIDNFDSVLAKPYLNNYNASLNIVPVVGLKGNQIMYIQTDVQTIPTGSGLTYVWSNFSSLPPDATIKPDDKVFLFPYMGDFCLAIGRSVWKKAHLNERDPAISSAVDNWPNLYVKDWVKLGDNILPANDLAGVVPFSVLSADGKEMKFQLVVLASDGTLSYLSTDTLSPDAVFEPLMYKAAQGSPPTPPRCDKIAYWNGQIVAIDTSSITWNFTPAFDQGTYSAANPIQVEAVTEFTATDVGPIGLRADGYLYKRIVEAPPADSTDDATLKWIRWVKADGVTNLGVASPGVMLDLNLLTRTLRSRYIDVQTSVYPVVDKIRAFGITHGFYLDNVLKDAETWQNASTDEQRALAIKNAKSFIAHSKTWSLIVSRSVGGAKQSVNIMTKQLHDVRVQLEAQLVLLKDRLTGLQATLNTQQQLLSKLNAAFWGSIAALFLVVMLTVPLGIIIAAAGVVTGMAPLLVAGGVLFAGGFIATIVLSTKISELQANMSDTQSQIRVVNTAIDELSTIVQSFTDLDNLYGTLNMFWGRMQNDASAIQTIDDATAFLIGEEILSDTSSITASQEMTSKMTIACQTYLDVLNMQGIQIPTQSSNATMTLFSTPNENSVKRGSRGRSLDIQFHKVIDLACENLKRRDLDAYCESMKYATLLHLDMTLSGSPALRTGLWFDIPALRSSASVWLSGSQNFSQFTNIIPILGNDSATGIQAIVTKASSLDGSLDGVGSLVQKLLMDVISLGHTIQVWAHKFPQFPTSPEQEAEVAQLQAGAVSACETAQHKAALANNSFSDFNNQAREYQQALERQIRLYRDEIVGARAAADAEIRNLSPPWEVVFFGNVLLWRRANVDRILADLRRREEVLEGNIIKLTNLQSSGTTFEWNALTWKQMVQMVSTNLGDIYNILSGVWGQLLEDPRLYEQLVKTEWGQLADDAHIVLQILDVGSRGAAAMVSASPHIEQGGDGTLSKKEAVIQALSPKGTLGSRVKGQATDAQNVFEKLDLLLQMPYGRDIIGYWDDQKTERQTLLDVVANLRTEYVQMVATEYDTIQQLYSLSILQEYRAKNVIGGKMPLPVFVQATLLSVRAALKAATSTSDRFGASSQHFDYVLGVIANNIDDIETKITGLDSNIETAKQSLRDKIIWVVADVIALSFAAAALLVTFGFVGPVVAAVTLSAQIAATAAGTAASVKLVLDSLSLDDIVKTIESLKSLQGSLRKSLDNLKAVQPLFKEVVAGVHDLTSSVTDMQRTLDGISNELGLVEQLVLTSADAEAIVTAWAVVRKDTQTWMDVINGQGISPITFSVKQAA